MRIYKDKYIERSFTTGGEWMTRNEKGQYTEYIGPIISYSGEPFGGEKMSPKLEKEMKLYEFEASKDNILYDEIKPKYSRNFIEPIPYKHRLTDEEKEKGEYSRYFCEILNLNSIVEVNKEQHKYFKKDSTPYHKNIEIVEIKLKTSVKSISYNKQQIAKAAEKIKEIKNFIMPTDYMNWPRNVRGIQRDRLSNRFYPEGDRVPDVLPKAYQEGNGLVQTNPIVPIRQNCAGCIFHENGWCEKFGAEVKENYWCAKYIYDIEEDTYYRPDIDLPE